MALPQANFNYSPTTGFNIQFNDLSSNGPTSWLWDFGDGNTAATASPSHDFTRNGFFNVKLTVTNADGSGEITFPVGVSDVGPVLSQSVYQLVNQYLPPNVVYDASELSGLIQKQQLFIHPLVNHEIDLSHIYNEFHYKPLENTLIASLVAYDILIQQVNSSVVATNNGGTTSAKSIKSIKTGPTEVQWYGESESSGSSSSSSLSGSGGLDKIIQSICSLAYRLNIYIPVICDKAKITIAPIKGKITSSNDCLPCGGRSNIASQG